MEVIGGPPNSSGLLVVTDTQGAVCAGGVCLCVSPIRGTVVPVSLDAIGRAVFVFRVPTCTSLPEYYFQYLGLSSVSPYFGASPALRLSGL